MAHIDRTVDKKIEFIKINHYFTTVQEMSDEIGLSIASIYAYCREFNWSPITEADRRKDFILKNQHLTVEELMQNLDLTDMTIRRFAKEMGIALSTNKQKEKKAAKNRKLPTEFTLKIVSDTPSNIEVKTPNDQPIIRVPGVYTQSGSDLTDSWYGKTTTKRVKVNASDAFFK